MSSNDIYSSLEKEPKKAKKKGFIKRHKVLSVIVALILVAAIVFGVLFATGVFSNEKSGYSYIRTTTLSKGSLEDSISSTGTIESAKTSNVTTSLNYTVKKIAVAVGDSVKKGDVICTLDTKELEEQIATERKNISKAVKNAQTSYNNAKSSYDTALSNLNSYKTTLNSAKNDYNSAKTPYLTAKSAISSAQKAYNKALSNYNSAGSKLVVAQNNYNNAISKNKDVVSAAKKYMQAIQDLYGNCSKGSVDISDSSSTTSNQSVSNSKDFNSQSANISSSTSNSVAVNQTANDMCLSVQKKVYSLTNTTVSIPSGSNTLYKLGQKAAALQSAKTTSNYQNLESAYTTAKSTYDNAKQTNSQYEDALKQAKSQLNQASDQLQEAQSSDTLEELESQLDDCTIKANQSGTIVSLNATVGSAAGTSSASASSSIMGASGSNSSQSAVATISDLNKLKVSITISEADINNAKIGLSCYITSDATDATYNGTLSQIDPTANDEGTFGAEVTIDDKTTGLSIGMNASAEIIVSSTDDVFFVPIDAVGKDNKGKFVYRKTGGSGTDMTFEKVYVGTGDENDYYIEISSEELAEGDVIRSSSDLSEGIETTGETSDSSQNSNFSMFGGNMSNGGNMPSGFSSNKSSGNLPSPPSGGQ